MNELPSATSEALLALGGLALKFATVNRVTMLADGVTPESDTDHTVMVGLVACALAQASEPSLDVGKVAQFAFVHDLVEAYAGDTNTFNMTDGGMWQEKKVREDEALERIRKEFDATLPWISKTIEEYESLESPEARFVKTVDKAMPKITRIFNNGAVLSDPEEFRTHYETQFEKIKSSYGKDQLIAQSFYQFMIDKVLAMLAEKKN